MLAFLKRTFRVGEWLRRSLGVAVIMLASFSLMTLTRMEVAVAGPVVTQQAILVEHDAEIKWKAMINATKDQLKAAPEFKFEGKFPKSVSPM